ncbi:PD-(D/E)XK nuclease superfamily protein [Ruminococcaceae bacterium YRB3002]|nr:PD-(D/E)XK nuclease superfamily protein [Ruminococcaceae bacterium YRB3002]
MSNKIKYSEEQKVIVYDGSIRNTLVSASAGSGKTTVLVGRIINEIIEERLSIEDLLVLTFTNDAADHMAEEIEIALRDRINEARVNGDTDLVKRLSEQLDMLPNAYIQTIDSFCSRVIKEKGHLVKTPEEVDVFASGNVILDESNLTLILNRAAELALADMYADNGDEDSDFILLTQRFGDGRTDDSLIKCLINVYRRLRSVSDYPDKVDGYVDKYRTMAQTGDLGDVLGDLIRDVREVFEKLPAAFEESRRHCEATLKFPFKAYKEMKRENNRLRINDPKVYVDDATEILYDGFTSYVTSVLEKLNDDSLSTEQKYEAIRDVSAIREVLDMKIMGGVKSKAKCETDEDRALRRDCNCFFAVFDLLKPIFGKNGVPINFNGCEGSLSLSSNYPEILGHSYREHVAMMQGNVGTVEVFAKMIHLIDRYYAELKASVNGCDFADQELGAYRILCTEEAQEHYRRKFKEIYIDEYQDNSELQDAIIQKFARDGEGNVFRVGDIKQSIYKFRNADPDLFNEHFRRLNAVPQEEAGVLRTLAINRRSSVQILDFVNFVMGQVMTYEGAEIEYDDKQRLVPPDEEDKRIVRDLPRVVVVDRNADFIGDLHLKQFNGEADDDTESGSDPDQEEPSFSAEENKAGTEEQAEERVTEAQLTRRLNASICYGVLNEVNRWHDEMGIDYGDIWVLAKTISRTKEIAGFLRRKGIPATSEDRTKVFQDMDIQSVINLIIAIGNECRDEYLMSVMLKNYAFANFTLDDIAAVQAFIFKNYPRDYRGISLMSRLRIFVRDAEQSPLRDRVEGFISTYDDLRTSTVPGDIDDLTDQIFRTTGIMANVMHEDNFGSAKLLILKDWLSSNFKRYGSDFGSIAARLEEMKIKISSDARFDAKDASEDSVKCMSIHKSKGLGRKCIILVIDDEAEPKGKNSSILIDKNMGFVADVYDSVGYARSKSLHKLVYEDKKNIADNAEKLRLLYVALTRAKEHLSIVTAADISAPNRFVTLSDAARDCADVESDTFGRRYWLTGHKTMGYSLFSSLARASCGTELRQAILADGDDNEVKNVIESDCFDVVLIGEKDLNEIRIPGTGTDGDGVAEGDTPADRKIIKPVPADKEKDPARIPFKVSYSGINDWKVSESTHIDLRIKDKEEFVDRLSGKITAAGKGTIVHLIMQWGDPGIYGQGRDALIAHVRELIDEGLFNKFRPDDVLKVADEFANGIVSYAGTEIGRALYAADLDGRAQYEKPVVFAIPAYEGAEKNEDYVLVQGKIDAIYEEDDGSVIVDYKTDNYGDVPQEVVIAEAKKNHKYQIDCYEASCESSGIHIKAKYLYLVRYSLIISV